MQLTWLIGAPGRPVSVHRRVVGRYGLGSPATQLMRAVRQLLPVRSMVYPNMIRQQVGDVLEIEYEGRCFYVVILTRIVMFGGNVVFAYHNDGQKMSLGEIGRAHV